tara:strand:+ start:100 stop:546 length:447 start_codon:yes stop_codon:yes gene_type:complete
MKKIFFILLFLSSCGYQPIYINKNLENFEFQEINLVGEKDINNKIINSLALKENKIKDNLNTLLISSSTQIEETAKSKEGQVKSFRTIVSVKLEIRNIKDDIIKSKNFFKEFTYNNKQNKFELVEYQSSIKNDLVDKIVGEIIIYLNL